MARKQISGYVVVLVYVLVHVMWVEIWKLLKPTKVGDRNGTEADKSLWAGS